MHRQTKEKKASYINNTYREKTTLCLFQTLHKQRHCAFMFSVMEYSHLRMDATIGSDWGVEARESHAL